MKTIKIDLGSRSYPIFIGQKLFKEYNLIAEYIKNKRVAIVTNTTIEALYLDEIKKLVKHQEILSIVLPDGEQYKNQESLTYIYDQLLSNKYGRDSLLIALGGGVIGDITGYAAATYMRGIDFIQVPTTLLSQVDSSVGGKTGINHSLGKNMIGAFYQPKCVLINIDVLKTLPDRELRAGLAEVIKYGLIRDKSFFEWLEKEMHALLEKNPESLMHAISVSCENKAQVVSEDEFESQKGIRATLNFGHTFGHAIENVMGYGSWLHGEAVACGMVMAAYMSMELGLLTPVDFDRIKSLIGSAELPSNPPDIKPTQFLDLMQSDKKTLNGQINLILLKGIGHAFITNEYSQSVLLKTISQKQF
jgi:3-dehydroquinate synthase